MTEPIRRDTPPPPYLVDPDFEGVYNLCPYDQDVNGKEVYCNCSPEKRRACADDI